MIKETQMFLRGLEGWHIVIIVALVAVLFGAKRMPDAARSVGQSLRIFKSEMKASSTDDVPEPAHPAAPPASMTSNAAAAATPVAPTVPAAHYVEPVPAARVGTPAQ